VDLLPALPAHQDGMSDRGHRTRLRLCSGIIPKADGVQMRGSHGSDRASPELEPLQRHKGVGFRFRPGEIPSPTLRRRGTTPSGAGGRCSGHSQLRGPSRVAGFTLVGFGAKVASGSSDSIMAIS
jgi:hypothetical protein